MIAALTGAPGGEVARVDQELKVGRVDHAAAIEIGGAGGKGRAGAEVSS